MKHNSFENDLYKGFLEKWFNIKAEQLILIDQYCLEIKKWSVRQNLVSRSDLDQLYEKHVFPSVIITKIIKDDPGQAIADIGSGSGFPGVIIKILLPERSVFLIDSSRKKYLFLLELCEKLNLSCKVINERVESLTRYNGICFDLIVSRAVAPLASLWNWSEKSLAPEGSLYVLKGGDIDNELRQVEEMNLNIKIIRPDSEWRSISDTVMDKLIVRIRRKHDQR